MLNNGHKFYDFSQGQLNNKQKTIPSLPLSQTTNIHVHYENSPRLLFFFPRHWLTEAESQTRLMGL